MLTSEDKKFIVESVRKGGYRVVDLAKMFNVTPRRIQQILKEDLSGDRPPEEVLEAERGGRA